MTDYIGTEQVVVRAVGTMLRVELGAMRRRRSSFPPAMLGFADTVGPLELEVASDGSWFRGPGMPRADCSKRPVLRRLVAALARAPRGVACSFARLVEAGWPGEKMSRSAARNRLHVSLNRLRALGLAAILLTTDDGYLLDPEAVIHVR